MDMLKKNRSLVLGGALLVSALLIGATALTVGAQANRNSSRDSSGCGGNNGGYSGMMGMGSMMGDVDRHFIEQMIPHHQGAIAMANLALEKAQRPEIKALAADIKRTQTAEIEQMRTWYKEWYGVDMPTTNTSTGSNSGNMMGGGMSGMMGGAINMNGNTQDLATASDFDKAFIEQMIPHHQMAVMMAGMVLAGGEKAKLRTLAQSISTSQSAEIEKMSAWYKSWYGTSAP